MNFVLKLEEIVWRRLELGELDLNFSYFFDCFVILNKSEFIFLVGK